MLRYSLEVIAASEAVAAAVLVVPERALADFGRVLAELPQALQVEVVVAGGATRQESVRLGLAAVDPGTGVVLCHDAARPLATPDLFRRVLDGLEGVDGCVPLLPSPDTVKLVRDGRVTRTIPRDEIGLAQTPQAFSYSALRESHRLALREGAEATDDAMLVEVAGYTVAAVEGEISNFKITTQEDLRRAEQVLAARSELVEGAPP
jgi:2-C-methyl-D-erythritol 4-phosphate cytidylyltransferase